MSESETKPLPASLDVIIVGAGFGGMYMLHRLRGLGLSARILEGADGVGGTWYWNRYPGARCDVESMQYSFSFDEALQQEWQWSERFAAQPEILRYANHVADRFDLRRDIHFETRVASARFDEAASRWTITTDKGQVVSARFCVMATGCLSAARLPDIPGIRDYTGETYHTGFWPHRRVDFAGKRVAVIGTGSSAIQAIPVIAAEAAQVTVFQRTPNFSIPSRNAPMDAEYEGWWKRDYREKRQQARMMRTGILYALNPLSALEVSEEERNAEYERRWTNGGTAFMGAFSDLILNKTANDTAAEFVRNKIRATVKDPATAEALAPKDHPIGTKRICVDTHYYETYNRPNVRLVNLRQTPIETITATGIRTSAESLEFDAIVFATGFDAMTGALLKIDFEGRGGRRLSAEWEHGPRSYLGLMVAGFPNLLTITGPGSPSVLSNMIVSIEQHVDWIAGLLGDMQARGRTCVEATDTAQEDWVRHGEEVANRTLYPSAASWYMGANIPGKPRVFMPYIGGVGVYREKCDEIAAGGYTGFAFTPARVAAAAE
ncbi:flavin-containing monooxygenase [Paracraurococcus ruber]|uniref:Cyclohexanone monooxygenase n=1 Tax=Paracraurococcus ruber TaxID=77675 RepID=A0ABS1CSH4_9PROT|nr:NAD(P)/FAD-dependent oxidoreductase [Paracraurococcus ruber]MBK1657141.1 cyclohexanone monooxygenase [Paracraurococcus ruber]TDG31688.1 NAD(P)/FAD-dependent oxidoreductase [Paracraurococcus ruber]